MFKVFMTLFQGPCTGDSGGPLFVNFGDEPNKKKQTLEGIVSGGFGCGKNTPAWYTRVRKPQNYIKYKSNKVFYIKISLVNVE